jgi:hypothetical protein
MYFALFLCTSILVAFTLPLKGPYSSKLIMFERNYFVPSSRASLMRSRNIAGIDQTRRGT